MKCILSYIPDSHIGCADVCHKVHWWVGLVIATYQHGLFGYENIRHALVSRLHEGEWIEHVLQVEDWGFCF